jgi:hypothetical protein
VVIHRSERSAISSTDSRLRTLNAMVYDPRDGRIVDVDIPFWLLRMMPAGGRFSFLNGQGVNFDSERTRLTVEDLEQHGAGLILDHRDRRGAPDSRLDRVTTSVLDSGRSVAPSSQFPQRFAQSPCWHIT